MENDSDSMEKIEKQSYPKVMIFLWRNVDVKTIRF